MAVAGVMRKQPGYDKFRLQTVKPKLYISIWNTEGDHALPYRCNFFGKKPIHKTSIYLIEKQYARLKQTISRNKKNTTTYSKVQ